MIHEEIIELHDRATADTVRIQYEGPMKASDVAEIVAQSDIDGVLADGANLKAKEFAAIALFS